ncbi:hypothetical protein P7K49_029152 [Saguinus oedipus]|uniref:Uncharacterized protein n=1 Tax=Saguinus oedipus TaxID=9490 RepID=A0ABQ9U6D5_SAGOE|nr:hypothetical protein P7K49_029152 [Saguinus oedipus]
MNRSAEREAVSRVGGSADSRRDSGLSRRWAWPARGGAGEGVGRPENRDPESPTAPTLRRGTVRSGQGGEAGDRAGLGRGHNRRADPPGGSRRGRPGPGPQQGVTSAAALEERILASVRGAKGLRAGGPGLGERGGRTGSISRGCPALRRARDGVPPGPPQGGGSQRARDSLWHGA